uniref:CSON012986 protein n=1 Tax=Culicoides sonorensis TaxID=179676 RepID=A0A336LZX7_CULSO
MLKDVEMQRASNKSKSGSSSESWKRPDEVLKLQRIKQKKRALQQRFNGQQISTVAKSEEIGVSKKRKNPFSTRIDQSKRHKSLELDEVIHPDDTIFELLANSKIEEAKNIEVTSDDQNVFDMQHGVEDANDVDLQENKQIPTPYLPIDWTIKSRLRLLCRTQIPGNNLKTNQEASGTTSFVRCIDPNQTNAGLDISPGARFHQSTLYWQYPHLPWLTMYPRNSKTNHGFNIGELEAKALHRDWTDAFRSLFQLIRSRQCPYFYVCANSFTVLFRAAGIGGRVETHAFLTPTSRGMRSALRNEDIEFTMPLKKTANDVNRSTDSVKSPNTSTSNSSEDTTLQPEISSDEDEEKWLASLGVEADQIKKINEKHYRKIQNKECEDDFSEQSICLIEGVDCQAFFNFLLNSKSSIAKVGRLANVPPTLLAPVAFQGASLRQLSVRSSKVRLDDEDYSSMEIKGVILPHCLPYLANLLSEIKDCFSATLMSHPSTIGFNSASIQLLENLNKENAQGSGSDLVFGRENLSDCGMPSYILESMCRTSSDSIKTLDKMWYVKELGGFLHQSY